MANNTKHRPYLSEGELDIILNLLYNNMADNYATKQLYDKLYILHLKASSGVAKGSYTPVVKPSLIASLGGNDPEAPEPIDLIDKRRQLYKRMIAGELLSSLDKEAAETFQWELEAGMVEL